MLFRIGSLRGHRRVICSCNSTLFRSVETDSFRLNIDNSVIEIMDLGQCTYSQLVLIVLLVIVFIVCFNRKDSYVMLDCGEGTYGQLVRSIGAEATAEVMTQLRGVYVSHHHADHHIGLINILLHRRRALQQQNMPVSR